MSEPRRLPGENAHAFFARLGEEERDELRERAEQAEARVRELENEDRIGDLEDSLGRALARVRELGAQQQKALQLLGTLSAANSRGQVGKACAVLMGDSTGRAASDIFRAAGGGTRCA